MGEGVHIPDVRSELAAGGATPYTTRRFPDPNDYRAGDER